METFTAPLNTKSVLELAAQLSRTEQIDLLYYLARSLNRPTKMVHLHFIPHQPDEISDQLFTDEEFENLLDWLQTIRHQDKDKLKLPLSKRSKLIELIAETFMQELPNKDQNFWPEDDIELFDQFIHETRSY